MNAGSFHSFRLLLSAVFLAILAQPAFSQVNNQELIAFGSTWKFWNQEAPPRGEWKSDNFNDSAWQSGPAQLGYGDGDEATVTRTGPTPHPMTAYFRRNFLVENANLGSPVLRLVRDDGAVVYINGQEVVRDAMPDGPIGHNTAATITAGGDSENRPREFILPSAALRPGTNVIAVEVHQANPTSSDLSFDFDLHFPPPDAPGTPIVGIVASQAGTSEPIPTAFILPGIFTVSRSELDMTRPLRVNLEYSGTASEKDYSALPASVVIPPGMNSIRILVLAQSDDLVEGTESVLATIVQRNALDPGLDNRPYTIDPVRPAAEVKIGDEDAPHPDLPVVSLRTVNPTTKEPRPNEDVAGGIFRLRRTGSTETELSVWMRYEGTATPGADFEALPDIVTFKRGEAEVDLQVFAPDDGIVEPTETVHAQIIYSPAAAAFVTYTIHPTDNSGTVFIHDVNGSSRASLRITHPDDNAIFPLGATIQISAVAVDLDGYIPRVEFYSGDNLIGVSEIAFIQAPPDGTPITHSFEWHNAPPGRHEIHARAVEANGSPVRSLDVTVFVEPADQLPIVSVRFQPHLTDEAWPDADFAPGSFDFRRTGPTNLPLAVYFLISGTATPGVDYQSFDTDIVFPAGERSIHKRVEAIDDLLAEGNETVVLTLTHPPMQIQPFEPPFPGHYLIGPEHHSAELIILDNDDPTPGARIEITKPRNGEVIPLGEPIQVDAVAVDPEGYIPRLEFYAGDRLIGVSEIVFIQPPPDGTPIEHSIIWSNAPSGRHELTARGLASNGQRVISDPVTITVTGEIHKLPVIAIEAIDPDAAELTRNGTTDPAVFVVRRTAGPTNLAVTFLYQVSGRAQNGIDFERLSGVATLRAGQLATEIVVRPLPDPIAENEETVVLSLIDNDCRTTIPLFQCYHIGSPSIAHAFIRDGSGTNVPPRIRIVEPRDGQVFALGQTIPVRTEAFDLNGMITQIELYIDDQLAWVTNNNLVYLWPNASMGEHTLRAEATDNSGARVRSDPVRILVRESSLSFVERHLPESYTPGVPLTVVLIANPPVGTQAWAVEDQPPQGWTVSSINEDGVYDPVTRKVKFGHFTESFRRRLSYNVTPPPGATGEHLFNGTASADGQTAPVAGDRLIRGSAPEHHPADANKDNRLMLVELTAHAAAWKNGSDPAAQPPEQTIPLSYVTRAAMIWRQGEAYHFAASVSAPLCWVPNARNLLSATAASTAVRSSPGEANPGEPLEVTITIQPATGTSGYALEENVPHGWNATNISDDGIFNPGTATLRWGVFLDSNPRTFRYTLTPPPGIASTAELRGTASFDGSVQPVTGSDRIIAVENSTLLTMPRCERLANGSVHLLLMGAPGQVCVLEASTDLQTWTVINELFLPDGQLEVIDTPAGQNHFYRLRVP